MREYKSQKQETKEEHEDNQIKTWLADSHFWVEDYGTFICKWCKRPTTASLDGDATLCLKNPEIEKLIN